MQTLITSTLDSTRSPATGQLGPHECCSDRRYADMLRVLAAHMQQPCSFATRLRAAREASGLTRSEVGRHIGVTQKRIWYWENLISEPSLDLVAKLALTYRLSIDWLISGNGDPIARPSDLHDRAD